MAGISRKTGSRMGARVARLAAIGVIAALTTIFTPGTASAAGEVTPVVNCIMRVSGDADWIAVLGYTNSAGQTVTYLRGSENNVSPSPQNGGQPTVFEPGTHSGVFTITMNANETAIWTVSGRSVTIKRTGPDCPAGTQLPADGNGTGTAVALGAAGVVGAAVLYRFRRRMNRMSGGPASADAEV